MAKHDGIEAARLAAQHMIALLTAYDMDNRRATETIKFIRSLTDRERELVMVSLAAFTTSVVQENVIGLDSSEAMREFLTDAGLRTARSAFGVTDD